MPELISAPVGSNRRYIQLLVLVTEHIQSVCIVDLNTRTMTVAHLYIIQ